jgi:hypothetical protein
MIDITTLIPKALVPFLPIILAVAYAVAGYLQNHADDKDSFSKPLFIKTLLVGTFLGYLNYQGVTQEQAPLLLAASPGLLVIFDKLANGIAAAIQTTGTGKGRITGISISIKREAPPASKPPPATPPPG